MNCMWHDNRLAEENKMKPKETHEIEGADEAISAEMCATHLREGWNDFVFLCCCTHCFKFNFNYY